MKKIILSLLVLLVAAVGSQAKSWKIGPSSVTGMDFASINAAMSSSLVTAGDTLYLDQYYNESQEQTVTKRVVIIGTGYDTSFTDEQVVARLTNSLNLKAANTVVKSVRIDNYIKLWAVNCTIERCYMTGFYVSSVLDTESHLYSCYIAGNVSGYGSSNYSKLDIQNCVILQQVYYLTSSVLNNNVIYYNSGRNKLFTVHQVDNSTITNNYIFGAGSDYYSYSDHWSWEYDLSAEVVGSGSGNTIEHNIFSRSSASYYPNNKFNGTTPTTFFICNGQYSDYYKLNKETGDNPAIGYATDGGDIGCHGGMFGCPSGGRPQYIPYFSKVVVGSRTENGKLPVSVTVKIQDE